MDPITAYILLWTFLGATAALLTAVAISHLTNSANPWYVIGMTLGGATTGIFLGGIYIAWTWGLDALQPYSLIIPVLTGSFVALVLSRFLPKVLPDLPWATKRKYHPMAAVVALLIVVGLGFASIIPALPSDSGETSIAGDIPDFIKTNYEYGVNSGVAISGDSSIMSFTENQIQALQSNPTIPMDIDAVHSAVNYPGLMADDPSEGDTMGWRLTFTVRDSSPSDWNQPVVCIMYWGDTDGDGTYDSGEPILTDNGGFNRFTATPTSSTYAKWRAPAVWVSSENEAEPAFMMYNYVYDGKVNMLGIHYASDLSSWRNDGGKTFDNLANGYDAPYDQLTWYWDQAVGTISPKETINTYQKVLKGNSIDLEGKLYCPDGMSNITSNWNLRVIMFDMAYSTSEPINSYDMSFQVGDGGGGGGDPPIIDPSSIYWIATAGLFFSTIGAFWVAIRYGPKLVLAA